MVWQHVVTPLTDVCRWAETRERGEVTDEMRLIEVSACCNRDGSLCIHSQDCITCHDTQRSIRRLSALCFLDQACLDPNTGMWRNGVGRLLNCGRYLDQSHQTED